MYIYADMDGFLVKYNYSGYIGENPLYLQKGMHYFRDLEPDEKAITVLKLLSEQKEHEIKILTQVSNQGLIYMEHVIDKMEWLKKYAPFIDVETQFIPVVSDKQEILSMLLDPNRPLFTLQHVLIDDWNPNLNGWHNAGGTALKYCNGLNSPNAINPKITYPGINLTQNMTAEEIVTLINMLPNKSLEQPLQQNEPESDA